MADQAPATPDTPIEGRQMPRQRRSIKRAGSTRQTPRSSSRRPTQAISTGRNFLAGRVENPERVIALELILVQVIYVAVTVKSGKTPAPRVMATLLAVYAILALLTIFGPKWGRIAYLFGGLILMGTLFNKEVAQLFGVVSGSGTPAEKTVQTLIPTALGG